MPANIAEVLAEALDGLPPLLREPCHRLIQAGGKHLRASLVLAAAGDEPAAVPAAAAVELLHLATLVHDDLLDDLLDLLSDEPTCGKPTGVDFAAGTVTLPAVHELAAGAELPALLRPGLDAADRRRANDLLRAGPGIAATVEAVHAYARRARDRAGDVAALAGLPDRYVARQMSLVLPRYRHLVAVRPSTSAVCGVPPSGAAATAYGPGCGPSDRPAG